jgi:hypothetical protein
MADEIQETPVEQTPTVQAEVLVEKVEEAKVDEPKVAEVLAEAPKVEEAPKEQLAVEPKVEIVVEKVEEKLEVPKVEEPVVSEKEQLTNDIKQTKEELSVIKEVREELVSIYAANSTLEKDKEALSKDNESLKTSVEQLTSQLQKYKDAEEKLAVEQKKVRLENLSAKFKVLGQDKSVEQLSGKDEETLSEFEKIVDAAIERLGDNKEQTPVTVSTQAEKLSEAPKQPVETKSNVVAKTKEPLSNSKFFAGICNTLTKEQTNANNSRRAKYL